MNNSTVNFTAPETSTNYTIQSIRLLGSLNVCMHSISFLFGFPTHSYVIWLIITGSRVASGLFNLNLSVCEIGNCLISFINIFHYCTGFSPLTTLSEFLIGLGITGRPLFQCLMCVERYLAVVHPVTFLKFKPLRYRVICCTTVWIITLGCCLCCMYTISLFYIFVCFYSIQFILFLSIQLFCCVTVLRALKQSGPGERGSTVGMIIFYVPFTISGFFFILTHKYIIELFSFSFICNVLVGFVQPVLYLHRVGKLSCLFSP